MSSLTRTFLEYLPAPRYMTVAPSFTSTPLDASNEKLAYVGPVIWSDPTSSKSIETIGFLPGTVTDGGGTLRVSLQNVDTASTTPSRGDGTQDQYIDVAVSALTTNTWYQTGTTWTSGSDRSVTYGEQIAIVFQKSGLRFDHCHRQHWCRFAFRRRADVGRRGEYCP
jgi:hypothetical protein